MKTVWPVRRLKRVGMMGMIDKVTIERVFQFSDEKFSNIKITITGDDAEAVLKEIYRIYFFERALYSQIKGGITPDLLAIYAKLDAYIQNLKQNLSGEN